MNNYLFLLLMTIKSFNCFEIDDAPIISTTDGTFIYTNGQVGRSNNQTDDIISTIYSTVASVSKDIDHRVPFDNNSFNNGALLGNTDFRNDVELKECRGISSNKEFTVRPSQRVCDYIVSRNHSGICSLDATLLNWNGDCRESWFEAAGKLECGSLSGTRSINFDRRTISLKMRSSDGILVVKQIPCSNQVTPPSVFINNLTLPVSLTPVHHQYPEPYIPPNLRPSTTHPDFAIQTYPDLYVPSTNKVIIDNEISQNKIDVISPGSKYPLVISNQNDRDQSISTNYRPNNVHTMYPGMKYGPPDCDRNSGVVISSPGYPNIVQPTECFLVIYPQSRICSPTIYFDFFEFGTHRGSTCPSSRLEIGGCSFCGILSGVSWAIPNNLFSPDGSLKMRLRGAGSFLFTVYFNTCQPGYNPYPPNQRQPWRCETPNRPMPQPYPIGPYQPPICPCPCPQPCPQYCRGPYNPCPAPSPPKPIPPLRPVTPLPPPQPPTCDRPICPPTQPTYPYPPKQPPPQPPFPYPPRPQPPVIYPTPSPYPPAPKPPVIYPRPYPTPQPPVIYPNPTPQPFPPPRPIPQPFPPPRPIPQPLPPPTYPQPYPPTSPCEIIRIPEGSISCSPLQPQVYCYRFEPPKGYCQMVVMLEELSMKSDQNCNKEYITTGIRDPRICQQNMENVPLYLDRGGYLQGKLMPGSSVRANFQGLPCSCNVDYRQPEFTLRGVPSQDTCQYTIHKANQGVCSLEMTIENLDLECGVEALIIDEKSYCGFRANERFEVPLTDQKAVIQYQRNGRPLKPGSFSIKVSQSSRCIQSFSSATGRDIKYRDDCVLPLAGVYGIIEFPGSYQKSSQQLSCTYTFPPRSGYCYVRLDFDDVDVPNSLDCDRYYLSINDIKYCGNTLSTSTKVLELDEEKGSRVSYKVDRYSRWRFTFSLLPCKQEILARSRNNLYSASIYK